MWLGFALGSAAFAGLVAILAKAGIRHVPSNLATALRTLVVLALAWLMVLVVGSQSTIPTVPARSLVFLVLSGLATGGAWLCYFRALQTGPVNPVVAVDRSSLALTVVLGMTVFGEVGHLPLRLAGLVTIAVGTYLVVQWQPPTQRASTGLGWLPYAIASAVLASVTTVLAKVGIEDVETNLGTAIRTTVVLVLAWAIVFATGEQRRLPSLPRRELALVLASGVATGASWLCFFAALQTGPVSAVVPVDKLSIVVTAALAFAVFGERLTRRGLVGLVLLIAGTFAMVA